MRTIFKIPSRSPKILARTRLTFAAAAAIWCCPMGSPAQALNDFIQLGQNRAGSYQYDGATAGGQGYTIVSGGNDIWDRWDECAFAYHELAGDFDIKVQVTEIQASGQWSKAGIMVRENMAEDSRRVMQSVSPCGMTAQGVNGACTREFLWRTGINNVDGENGGNHSTTVGSPNYPNAWIRMVRSGSVFTGYGSDNGVNWTLIASQDSASWQGGALPGRVLVGLAVSRHPSAGTNICRSVFANYAESTSNFSMVADSIGCPDKIFICFNRPYGPSALDYNNYALEASDVFPGNSVMPGPDSKTVIYSIEPMTEGFVYSIRATSNVLDANGNPIDPAGALGTFTHAKGFEKRKIHVQHNRTDGGALVFYEESKAYALCQGGWSHGNPPWETGFLEAGLPVFEDPLDANQGAERFSSRIVGVLSPAANMNARFAISTDDEGKLFIGSTDQPATKVRIAHEPVWNGNREYANVDRRSPPDINKSSPIPLVAGGKYYLELVFSEGGGGNWSSATWDGGSGYAFVNGQIPIQEANFVDSRFAWGHIFYNLGAVTITGEPQDVTVPVASSATFAMALDGTPPYKVTWRRNGVVIAGQTGASLTIPAVVEADNGATFSATIVNACGEATTGTATLTVLLNPRITSATSRGNCHAVFINFNKAMQLDGTYSMIRSNHANGSITPVTLSNIRHGATTSQIRFDVSPDLLPDTNTYYITVTGAHAQDGLTIQPNPSTVAFIHGAEYPLWNVMVRQYNDVGNGNLNAFLSSAKYVNDTPDVVRLNETGFFETPSNIRDNYGSKILGYYVAPATGNYQFWMSSDDQGATYISTDANPANKVQIAAEPAWGGIRGWTDATHDNNGERGIPPIFSPSNPNGNGSVPIPLAAGQLVYLEGVFTEGGGGDNYAATVVIDALDPNVAPPNGTLPILQDAFAPRRYSPDGAIFTTLCDVFCNPGPTDRTVFIGQSATFSAAPDGTPPYSLQWKRNGIVIPGATGATYTTPPATAANNNDAYTFVVSNEFSTNQCSATLHVSPNPRVVSCETRGHPVNVYVTYNKPVQLDGTYSIVDNTTGLTVNVPGRAYGSSQSEVVLTTSGLPPDHAFTLTVTGVHDVEYPPTGGNLIDPNPTVCTFGQSPGRACYDFNDNMLPPGTVSSGTGPPTVENGYLVLTRNGVTSQQNLWTIPVPQQTFDCFSARWQTLMNGQIGNAADGFSFTVGQNVGFPTAAEEGGSPGLSVTVDTFDNGGAEVGLDIRWNGNRLAFTQVAGGINHAPAALLRNQFIDAVVEVSPSGFVTFNYDTFTVSAQIPNYTGINANQYVFAARTGGGAHDTWIDNVCINDYTLGPIDVLIAPVNPTVPEHSSLTFSSTATGSPCHLYQWSRNGIPIPGATARTYTTPPLLRTDSGSTYSIRVANEFSTDIASSIVSVTPDNTAPVLVSVGSVSGTSIGVCFSEVLDPASAGNINNYSVAGANVIGVTLRPDGKSVILLVDVPPSTLSVIVIVNNIRDLSGNLIANNSTVTGFWWASSVDVGGSLPPGSAFSCREGDADVLAGGADIWGTADQFHYLYTIRAGDFDVQVKVERLDAVDTWSKAGIVARASLDGASASVAAYTAPRDTPGAGLYEAAIRRATASPTEGFGSNPATELPNAWIRLRRCGHVFTASHSSNAVNWIEFAQADTSTNPFSNILYVGLAATSHNTNQLTTAHFRNFGDAPLLITTQPADQTLFPGSVATFSVATCPPALSYQWRLNGANIPGATNSTLTLNNVQPADGGCYSVVVRRPGVLATSRTAVLLVLAPVESFTDAFGAGSLVDTSVDVRATNNAAATRQPGEPNHVGKPGGKSMWLRWISPLTGVVTFNTRGSCFDTLLAAYTGNNVSNLVHIASDDDSGGFLTSKITFNANVGVIYHIVVDGFAGESGNIVLSWQGQPGPHAPVIVSGPSNLVVRAGSNVTYQVIATNFPIGFQWYFNGNPLPGATGNILQISNVLPNNVGSYWVRAFSDQTQEVADSKAVRLEIASTPLAVSVDKLQELFPVPPGPPGFAPVKSPPSLVVAAGTLGNQILNNAGSTLQPGEPNHCGVLGGASRWFALENGSASPMTFIVDTSGSSISTIMAIYTGSNPLTLQLVACTNGPGSDSRVTFTAAPLGQYSVAVDGVNGATGIIQLNWRLGLAPEITQHPESRTVRVGQNYTNVVAATGLPTPQFQWISNSINVFRGTNAQMPVLNPSRSAIYRATASNFMGVATSVEASVAVAHPFLVDPQTVVDGLGVALRLGAIISSSPNATNAFIIQATTDLQQWTSIFTNRVPVVSTNFIDPDRALFPYRFYRVIPYPP